MNRALGLFFVAGLAISGPEACQTAQLGSAAETANPTAAELLAAMEHARLSARAEAAAIDATASAPPPEPEPWSPPAEPILEGLAGAGQALALGDPARALEKLEQAPAAEEGSREWFVRAAIEGRASRQIGNYARAVEALAPAWEHKKLSKRFVDQLLGRELGRAHVEWAQSGELDVGQADEHLSEGMKVLGKAMRLRPTRYQAPMRLEYTKAAAAVQGTDKKSRYWAGIKAVRSLDRTLRDYPNHPERAQLELMRARAKVKSNKVSDAAEDLRSIAIRHAGAPAAEAAFEDLEKLAVEHSKIEAKPFSKVEQLERAQHARGLRWMKTSREILDGLIADPDNSETIKRRAARQRGYTAYKQRDYETCVSDLLPAWERTKSLQIRSELSRCLDRGERYTEAIEMWLEIAESKGKKTGSRANALWTAIELAVRGGKYQTAQDILDTYEENFRGNSLDRRWLHAWLPYRLGDDEAALDGFSELEKRSDSKAVMARYYQGKILLRSQSPDARTEGAQILRTLTEERPLNYYGLQARQRLLDAQADPGPFEPELQAMPEEDVWLSYADTRKVFEELGEQFPEASKALTRADLLHQSGWIEEARRELRVAADEFINGKARAAGRDIRMPRNEDIVIGLGWKAEWSYPKVMPGKEMRRIIRSSEDSETMRAGLWKLSHALQEPYRLAKLSPTDYAYKSRWHPRAYRELVEREAARRHLDPTHMWALMYTESRFRRHVVSPVGARGALQIMPWTGRQLEEMLGEFDGTFNADKLFEIETNSRLSALYVSELMHKFHGQAPMAYGSYNGGPSNVARWLRAKSKGPTPLELDDFVEEIPFRETYKYVRRVMEVQAAYELLYRGELPRWTNGTDPVSEDNIAF